MQTGLPQHSAQPARVSPGPDLENSTDGGRGWDEGESDMPGTKQVIPECELDSVQGEGPSKVGLRHLHPQTHGKSSLLGPVLGAVQGGLIPCNGGLRSGAHACWEL